MSNNKKRKLEIISDLRRDPIDERYKFVTPTKIKSDVWDKFKVIKFQDNVENFAMCNICKDILSYTAKSGTGSLLRHTCTRKSVVSGGGECGKTPGTPQTQQTLSNFFVKKLSNKSMNELRKLQVGFIAKDLRPLNVMEGELIKCFTLA